MASGFFESIATPSAFKFYLNGEWKESATGATTGIKNPQTNEVAFNVQACNKEEVDAAFEGAVKAQKAWATTPLWKRGELVRAAARILREQADAIAPVLTAEVAKQAKSARSEIVRSAELMEYCSEEAVRYLGEGSLLTSDSFPGTKRNKLCLASKVPLGVVLCIPPFNYPVNLAVSKIAPALMAGNAVVGIARSLIDLFTVTPPHAHQYVLRRLSAAANAEAMRAVKPPTQGAVSGLHMMHAFHAAGFPPGLIQCITGKSWEIGDYMTTHTRADCISFTGGDTGIKISQKAGMVPLQMELGGKDVCIVCADADLELAAKSIISGGLSYQGQRCTAVKVVMVHDAVADELVAQVHERVKALTVGKPEDNCDICAVISEGSANWIEELVTDAKTKGATLLTEWRREGNLVWPMLIDHVTTDMKLAWEEQFGPVVPVMRISDAAEAVEHCNTSRLALQGCVFTKDINAAVKISDAMKTGTVQVNGPPARGPDHFPFQGFRDSGVGSQGIKNSLAMMCKTKTTVLNLPEESYTVG